MAIQGGHIVLSPILRDPIQMRVLQEEHSQVAGRPRGTLQSLGLPPQMKAAVALEAARQRSRPQGLRMVTQFQ